jgi:hypothetical protein
LGLEPDGGVECLCPLAGHGDNRGPGSQPPFVQQLECGDQPINLLALATFVRATAALPPRDAAAVAHLAARAAELGLPPTVLDDLQRLWTPQEWPLPAALEDDACVALYWTTSPE